MKATNKTSIIFQYIRNLINHDIKDTPFKQAEPNLET